VEQYLVTEEIFMTAIRFIPIVLLLAMSLSSAKAGLITSGSLFWNPTMNPMVGIGFGYTFSGIGDDGATFSIVGNAGATTDGSPDPHCFPCATGDTVSFSYTQHLEPLYENNLGWPMGSINISGPTVTLADGPVPLTITVPITVTVDVNVYQPGGISPHISPLGPLIEHFYGSGSGTATLVLANGLLLANGKRVYEEQSLVYQWEAPEPGSFAFAALGLLVLAWRFRCSFQAVAPQP
jgi:hypothetical protein